MFRNWLDGVAISASAICLIHCLILPILILALPIFGFAVGHNEWVHAVILAFAVPVSLYALLAGTQLHGKKASLLMGIVGLGALSLGLWLENIVIIGTAVTVIGSLFLAAAHWKNLRWRHQAGV